MLFKALLAIRTYRIGRKVIRGVRDIRYYAKGYKAGKKSK